MSNLLDLPDELIVHILDAFASQKDDILSFARTCRHAYSLAEAFLFRSILMRTSRDVHTLRILLENNKNRSGYVQSLTIVPFDDHLHNDMRHVAATMASLTKIEHLHLELPYSQAVDLDSPEPAFRDEFRDSFSQLSIQLGSRLRLPTWSSKLLSCYINLQMAQGAVVLMNDIVSVLAAPCITHVTIVNADLRTFKSSIYNIRRRTSPLKSLDLQSCIIDPDSSTELLSIPRALTKFSFYSHESIDSGEEETGDQELERICGLISALSLHRRSLKELSLTIIDEEILGIDEKAQQIQFNDLSSLQYLELRYYDSNDLGVSAALVYLPSSLTHLKVAEPSEGGWPEELYDVAWHILEHKDQLHSLQRLDVEWCPLPEISPELQERFGFVGVGLKNQRKVQFRVFRRTQRRNAEPPYLFDEYVPELVLVHDNYNIERLWETKTDDELKVQLEKKRVEDAGWHRAAVTEPSEVPLPVSPSLDLVLDAQCT